jgi:competence protein ComEC
VRYAVKDFHRVETPAATGVVVDEPLDTDTVRRFTYRADNGEKVLVSVPLYTPVAYGDRVEVKGRLARPGTITDEVTGRTFDYGAYLSKDDIYWTESFAEVTVLASGQGNGLRRILLKLKENFVAHIETILPEPQASLLSGLIVAGKGSLPANIIEDFRRAGVVHIVVLSGFNVTLIAVFLKKALETGFLLAGASVAPLAAAGVSALGIVLFVLMTGASSTVVRAAAMALIALGAKLLGRRFSASRALIVAAFAMLLINPKILVFDPSFQLSFLAALGLIHLSDPVARLFTKLGEWRGLKSIVIETIATQLTVLPLLIYSTGSVSLVSLPANLAVLPFVPLVMFVGFTAVFLSYLSPIIAWPVSFATNLVLSYLLEAAHLFGSLPFATVLVSPLMLGVALVCIAGFLLFAFRRQVVNLLSRSKLAADLTRRLKS